MVARSVAPRLAFSMLAEDLSPSPGPPHKIASHSLESYLLDAYILTYPAVVIHTYYTLHIGELGTRGCAVDSETSSFPNAYLRKTMPNT